MAARRLDCIPWLVSVVDTTSTSVHGYATRVLGSDPFMALLNDGSHVKRRLAPHSPWHQAFRMSPKLIRLHSLGREADPLIEGSLHRSPVL